MAEETEELANLLRRLLRIVWVCSARNAFSPQTVTGVGGGSGSEDKAVALRRDDVR